MVRHFERMGISGEAAEQQAQRMREMLQSPAMQAVFSDPQAMRAMLEADPMMRNMLRESPELQSLLSNPEELSRMARIMANPTLSREMLRGLDLQLQQAEAMGFGPELSSASSQVNRMIERAADQAAEEADRQRQQQSAAANPFLSLFGGNGGSIGGTGGTGVGTGGSESGTAEAPPLPWGSGASGGAVGTAAPFSDLFGGAGAGIGAGGLGLGGLPTDPASQRQMRNAVTQMMQNPAMRSMFQSQARTMVPAMLNANPQARAQFAAMGMADIETNPATMDRFVEMMTNPEMLGMMNRLEEAMQSSGGMGTGMGDMGGGGDPFAMFGGGGANPAGLEAMLGMFGGGGGMGTGMGGGGAPAMPAPAVADPETAYAQQLQQLNDMGFWDREANIRVLIATQGNVNAAVERLLSSPP